MDLCRRPLFLFTAFYIGGIVFAQAGRHWLVPTALAVALLGLGFALRRFVPLLLSATLAAVFLVGFLRATVWRTVPEGDVSTYAQGETVNLEGTVVSDPEPLGERFRFLVRATHIETYERSCQTHGFVMVSLYTPRDAPSDIPIPFYGDTVRIRGRLGVPRRPSNPGTADYRNYLARMRVFCTLSAGVENIKLLSPADFGIRFAAARFKAYLSQTAERLLPPVRAKLLLGILLGNYAALPPDVQIAFMKSGTMHLLAASGYNCAVIVGIFGFILRRLTAPRALVHLVLIALVWCFTLIAGPGPSIVRAAIMTSAFLAAYLLWRIPDMENIILFACLVILGFRPLALYDVGFQLSFAAVLAIVLALPLIEPPIRAWFTPIKSDGAVRSYIAGWLQWAAFSIVIGAVVSIVATAGTWPITAYYFNYFSIVSIVANALTALLIVLLSAAGIGMLAAASICPCLGQIVAPPTSAIAGILLGVIMQLGGLPCASLSVPSPSPIIIICYYGILLGVLEYARRKKAHTNPVDYHSVSRSDSHSDMVATPPKP